MAVSGTWKIFYDWGCDGGYSNTTITFNADGTFKTGEGYTGKWVQVAGMITWRYDSGTTYAGNVIGGAINGMQTTWSGFNGCFYCTANTATATATATAASATTAKAKSDSAGK